MKVLTILTYYRPHWTGLTQIAAAIAEGLARRGHEITVLTTRHNPELAAEEVVDGVRVIRLAPLARFSRGFITPAFPRAARRLIAEHEVVHIHTPLPESLLVAWLCRAVDRPLVMTHQGDLVMPAGVLNGAIERIGTAMLSEAGRLATRVTTHTRDYAEHSPLLEPFLPNLEAIYPPVPMPPPNAEAAAAWRRQLGLEGRKVVGFAGRFVEEKGFDFLLRAVPELVSGEPTVQLVYAGEREMGYERFYERCRPLVEAAGARLTFVGLIHDRQQLADFYAMCDVLAVPSRTDCFATLQVEAVLAGTPLVMSDIPGAREVVRATGMGLLAEPCNPSALARAILEVLGDPDRFVKDREAVLAVFNPDSSIDEYERVLDEAARRRDGLSSRDRLVLDRLLRNEADMAYRRRTPILVSYLELQDGERVLDVGCGMGFYLWAMARLGTAELVGLDDDPSRLEWARREGVPAELVLGDAEQLPFPDASFDKVLATEVLEHLEDDAAALREIWRVLRPGGVFAASVPNSRFPVLWDPVSAVFRALGRPGIRRGPLVGIWTNHRRLYTADQLAARIEQAGFRIEELEETTHYSVPFQHFLVYGVGKPLLERGLLPASLERAADRFSGERNPGRLWNPLNAARAAFRLVDRLNDTRLGRNKRTYVNVLVKARKPSR